MKRIGLVVLAALLIVPLGGLSAKDKGSADELKLASKPYVDKDFGVEFYPPAGWEKEVKKGEFGKAVFFMNREKDHVAGTEISANINLACMELLGDAGEGDMEMAVDEILKRLKNDLKNFKLIDKRRLQAGGKSAYILDYSTKEQEISLRILQLISPLSKKICFLTAATAEDFINKYWPTMDASMMTLKDK